MNKIDAVILLAFLAVDELRTALFNFLNQLDAYTLVAFLLAVWFLKAKKFSLKLSLPERLAEVLPLKMP